MPRQPLTTYNPNSSPGVSPVLDALFRNPEQFCVDTGGDDAVKIWVLRALLELYPEYQDDEWAPEILNGEAPANSEHFPLVGVDRHGLNAWKVHHRCDVTVLTPAQFVQLCREHGVNPCRE